MTRAIVVVRESDPEEEAKRGFIYVMMSFRIPQEGSTIPLSAEDQRRGYEEGTTILWKTLEDVEKYLDAVREGRDDRPFELRWNHLVVEKVYFGPYSDSEVVGWWRAEKQPNEGIMGYDLIKLEKAPFDWAEDFSNFTIST